LKEFFMWRALGLVALLGLSFAGRNVSGENLVNVYRESFEISAADHSDLPAGWKLLGGGSVKLDGSVVHEGKKALALTDAGGRQEITTNTAYPFEPNQSLQIRIWTYSELKRGQAALMVYWFDKFSRPCGSQSLGFPEGAHPWVESTFRIFPPPAATRLGLGLELSGTGTLRVDTLTITQLPRPRGSKSRRRGPVLKTTLPSTQPSTTRPADRPPAGLQVVFFPEKVLLSQGQDLKIRATLTHHLNDPVKIYCNLALFRGQEKNHPIGTKIYYLTVGPKQAGQITYPLEILNLPPGPYRLVCHAEIRNETFTAALPVDILPQGKSETPRPAATSSAPAAIPTLK
jgi:hypothetical protein